MVTNYVNGTSQEFLQIVLHAYHQEGVGRFGIYANIDIAHFCLLIAGHRTKQTERADSKPLLQIVTARF